jgi:hypothetical protein
MIYELIVEDSYELPTTTFETNQEYLNFVINMASKSYKSQYQTATVEDGITAAREAYNETVVIPEVIVEEPVPVVEIV